MNASLYNVLIVDDDPEYRKLNSEDVKAWGHNVVVAEGKGQNLYQDAIDKAKREFCHAAIVDMRLWDNENPNDKVGLQLIKELAPTSCIVYTGFGSIPITVEAVMERGAINLVSKTAPVRELQVALESALKLWHEDINIASEEQYRKQVVEPLENEGGDAKEIQRVLTKLFQNKPQLFIESISRGLRTPDKILHRQSAVFRATVPGEQPRIVKLTLDKKDIEREQENYTKYIRGIVGGNFRPELYDSWTGWNIGGVVYSLIGATGDIMPFSSYYDQCLHEKMALQQVVEPLRFFFETVWKPMFQESPPLGTHAQSQRTLFDTYNNLWNHPFKPELLESWLLNDKHVELADYSFHLIDPFRWLAENYQNSGIPTAQECVVHGDLHGENLLVNETHAWPIDFERTGRGHSLTDFVEMERNLITRMAGIRSPELFYEFALVLTSATRWDDQLWLSSYNEQYYEVRFALGIIEEHRITAHNCTRFVSVAEYLWGLLLDCMYVLTKLSDKVDYEERIQTHLLASIICARLEEGTGIALPGYPPIDLLLRNTTTLSIPPQPLTILFLSANPLETPRIQAMEEYRRIDSMLRRSEFRDRFILKPYLAVRIGDLQEAMLREQPTIVHFSGHGSEAGEIILSDEQSQPRSVSTSALSDLFSIFDGVKCVILNACFSFRQAHEIAEHVSVVLGMSAAITDGAAINFAEGFYRGIGFNRDVETAFKLGRNMIGLDGSDENIVPEILALNTPACNIHLFREF